MSTSPVTVHLFIVCPSGSKALVNDALRSIVQGSTGDPVTVALRKVGSSDSVANNGVAYAASWALDDTSLAALLSAVNNAPWSGPSTSGEKTIYGRTAINAGSVPALSDQRVFLFEGTPGNPEAVSFGEAIVALSLSRPYDPGPGV